MNDPAPVSIFDILRAMEPFAPMAWEDVRRQPDAVTHGVQILLDHGWGFYARYVWEDMFKATPGPDWLRMPVDCETAWHVMRGYFLNLEAVGVPIRKMFQAAALVERWRAQPG
jgi:hypothetical protein